ncbi:MAG: hypothetical protein QM784_07840 [Polyangiaceae bacterium]
MAVRCMRSSEQSSPDFRFDRWLEPETATRQSIRLAASGAENAEFAEPWYEVLTRTITFRAGGVIPGLVYLLELNDAEQDPGWGFAAYDGRALERSSKSDVVVFRTGPPDPKWDLTARARITCADALRVFRSSGCTASSCHGGSGGAPAAGLRLDDVAGLSAAIGRVARASDRAIEDGRVSIQPERFGLNMPLVLPWDPARSYLLYRVLLGEDAYRDAAGRFRVEPPSKAELDRATTWFGAMGPMPPVDVGYPPSVSPVDNVRVLESWIRDGADVSECEP